MSIPPTTGAPTVMVTYNAHLTGAHVARCPVCDAVCAYWDDEDLDEHGHLLCYCTMRPTVPDAGGYVPFAVMDDGGTLCAACVNDPSNPVHTDRTLSDGWQVIGWDHSGNVDTDTVSCDHCGRVIVDRED